MVPDGTKVNETKSVVVHAQKQACLFGIKIFDIQINFFCFVF
jgi:hypothetical protein